MENGKEEVVDHYKNDLKTRGHITTFLHNYKIAFCHSKLEKYYYGLKMVA